MLYPSAQDFQSFSEWILIPSIFYYSGAKRKKTYTNEWFKETPFFYLLARGEDRCHDLCFCWDIYFSSSVAFRLVHPSLSGTSDSSRANQLLTLVTVSRHITFTVIWKPFSVVWATKSKSSWDDFVFLNTWNSHVFVSKRDHGSASIVCVPGLVSFQVEFLGLCWRQMFQGRTGAWLADLSGVECSPWPDHRLAQEPGDSEAASHSITWIPTDSSYLQLI